MANIRTWCTNQIDPDERAARARGIKKVSKGMTFPSEMITMEHRKIKIKKIQDMKKFISSESWKSYLIQEL